MYKSQVISTYQYQNQPIPPQLSNEHQKLDFFTFNSSHKSIVRKFFSTTTVVHVELLL